MTKKEIKDLVVLDKFIGDSTDITHDYLSDIRLEGIIEWDYIHDIWEKFRDLRIDYNVNSKSCTGLMKHQDNIRRAMLDKGIKESFDELAEGVKFYNKSKRKRK